MTILSFVTQDELDNLDEDPRMAFLGLVNHAQRSLSQQIAKYDDPENEAHWNRRQELEQRFMNVIVAAGKRFEIAPFTSMTIPKHANYSASDYRQFESDLDHFVTQLVIDNSLRSKKMSVEILPDTKDKLRKYVHGLRTCVEGSNMHENKRKNLLNKLDEFEKELEKRRMNFLAVTLLSFEVLAVPGGIWASAEVAQKLITNITQTVAEAKQTEDKTRQIGTTTPPKALSPPRPADTPAPWGKKGTDLDDDIPF